MGGMDGANKKFLTLRTIFDRATVIGLRSEPEFRDSVELLAEESVQPTNDAYLAIFTLVAESTEARMLKLRIASTAVLGIQRYSIKRLNWQNVFVHGGEVGLFMEMLRCHFRHRQRKLDEMFMAVGPSDRRRWT